MLITHDRRTLRRSRIAALAASGALVLGGCGGTAGDDPTAALVENLVGQQVEIGAEVSEIIGPNAFTMAGDIGEAVLVIYTGTPQDLMVNAPIQVTGSVRMSFALAEAEEFAGAGLDDTAFEPFNGEPYIEASGVTTSATHRSSSTT